MINIHAITVCQPYEWLIRSGAKRVENRRTAFLKSKVGLSIALHAGLSRDWFTDKAWGLVRHAQRNTPPAERFVGPGDFIFGAVTCVVRVACVIRPHVARRHFRNDFDTLMFVEDDGWCVVLDQIRVLREPVPCRGQQGLWFLPDDVAEKVVEQLGGVPA